MAFIIWLITDINELEYIKMKKWIILVIVIVIVAILSFFIFQGNSTKVNSSVSDTTNTNPKQSSNEKSYSMSEISLHDSRDDCWLLIGGKVYGVTSFIQGHPGGDAILEGCGKDASALYNERTREDGSTIGSGTPHSEMARRMLEQFYIGNLK